MRILLVEDNPTDAHLLQELLKRAWGGEFEVEWIDRLAPAVERLRAGWADVLLLDLTLPDSDGLETVLAARAAAPALPIIVLTGLANMDLAKNALLAGVQDYLVKDKVVSEVLLRSLRYAIERADLQSALQQRKAEMHALLEAMPDTAFRLRRGGSVRMLKDSEASAAAATSIEELMPGEAGRTIMGQLAEVLASGEPRAVSYRDAADASEHVAHIARCALDDVIVVLR